MMGQASSCERVWIVQRAARIVSILCLVSALLPTLAAQAQLRTGRSERTLYRADNQVSERRLDQPLRVSQSPGRPLSTRSSDRIQKETDGLAGVALASDQSSILDGKRRPASTQPPSSVAKDQPAKQPEPVPSVPEMALGEDTSETTTHTEYSSGEEMGYYSDYSNCDDMTCLAPTCASGECYLGGGPLMNLLSRLSVRAEVPLFWRRAMGVPPLVTTSPTGTAAAVAGELGQSTTQILLGNRLIDEDLSAGFRITLGSWFGHDCYRGILFRYWTAGDQDNEFAFTHSQFPILARPFNNVTGAAAQDTQLIAFPGESEGSIRVSTTSQVDGLDVAIRRLAYQDRFTRVDWLVGYQHAKIDEGLTVLSSTNVTGAVPGLQGSSIVVRDSLVTENDFHGLMLGLMSTRRLACWSFESKFRLGMGNLRRQVNLEGATTTTSAQGAVATEAQGLLVRNTNNNPFRDDTFVVVPEVGLDIGYQLTSTLDFTVGYNYLLVPKVAQPGEQIDPDLSVNLSDPLAGALRPQLSFDERRYWVHSLNLGLQWRY